MWGEDKWRPDRIGSPEAWLRGGGGVLMLGRTLGGLDQGGGYLAFPLPNWPGKSAWLLARSYALRGPLWAGLVLRG